MEVSAFGLSVKSNLRFQNVADCAPPRIEDLLNTNYENYTAVERDFASRMPLNNAIVIPTCLRDDQSDCLEQMCNGSVGDLEDNSIILDTTDEADSSNSSVNCNDSGAISDQDVRSNATLLKAHHVLPQVSPLSNGLIISGTPILNEENSGNAVFDKIAPSTNCGSGAESATSVISKSALTFNGKFSQVTYTPAHTIIQIEPEVEWSDVKLEQSDVKLEPSDVKLEWSDVKLEPIDEEQEPVTDEMSEKTIPLVKVEKDPSSSLEKSTLEYSNERSPDLFGDDGNDDYDDDDDDDDNANDREDNDDDADEDHYNSENGTSERVATATTIETDSLTTTDLSTAILLKRDKALLKRLQTAVSGVLPPPSVTNENITLDTIVAKYNEHEGQVPGMDRVQSVYKDTHSVEKAISTGWPQLKTVMCHGIYYNTSNAIEQFEYLTVKYMNRFPETASSFVTATISSAKKRTLRTKALQQSPGRRLSHLARRKAIFSCANLQHAKEQQQQPATVNIAKIANRQILLVPRHKKVRTPTHKKKSPARKTPSSSSKKRNASMFSTEELASCSIRTSLTRETSKRSLFQSPNKSAAAHNTPSANRALLRTKITPELANRVDRSKRALFSSPKFGRYSTFSHTNENADPESSEYGHLSAAARGCRFNSMTSLTNPSHGGLMKRKRADDTDDEDGNEAHDNCKVLRTRSPIKEEARPNKYFNRSHSFTAEYLSNQQRMASSSSSLQRASSEMGIAGTSSSSTRHSSMQQPLALSDTEKKKLLWIVSQTLQRNQVDGKHPKFKDYATVMAKVVKRFYLESPQLRSASSVSEQMAKMANKIAFQVIQGKTELEIYSAEKLKSQSINRSQKLSGYITSADYELYKANSAAAANRLRRSTSSLFSEGGSLSFSQASCLSSATQSDVCSASGCSQQPVALQRQEEEGNKGTTCNVLRENIDVSEQQRSQRASSQKSANVFSGRDQKNVSPYSGGNGGVTAGTGSSKHKLLVGNKNVNLLKAKRQISFDT